MNYHEPIDNKLSLNRNSIVIINFVVATLSFVAFLIITFNDDSLLACLSPLVFGICFVTSLYRCMLTNKYFGFVFVGVAFIRYLLLPVLFSYDLGYHFRTNVYLTDDNYRMAYLLMYYELIVCSIFISYLCRRTKLKIENKESIKEFTPEIPKNRFIYFCFAVFILVLASILPRLLLNINFLLPNPLAKSYDEMNILQQMTIMGIMVLKQIIFSFGIVILKQKYDNSNNQLYYYLSILLVLFNISIYYGTNRSDFLLLFAASLIFWVRVFKKNSKLVLSFFIVAGIVAFLSLTITRNYYKRYGSELLNTIDTLQVYFGGVHNVAAAVKTKVLYPEQGNILTLFYDFARSMLGTNFIAKNINMESTNVLFNYVVIGTDRVGTQIVPAIGEGYFCLGFIFSPIVDLIFIYIAFKLYESVVFNPRTECMYFYIITIIRIGFVMGQNASIQINDLSFNIFVPLILMWLNRRIILKRKAM